VAKHLCGFDLLRLSSTCRWFRRLLADDSIWRYAFFRDLNLSDANPCVHRPLFRSWRYLYFAAFGKQSTKSIPPPVPRFGSLTDSRSRLLTRVPLLLTDGSHAFSFCQNGEHRSKRSETAGFTCQFRHCPAQLRCDTSSVYCAFDVGEM
jgi:hypothetical protein